MEVGVAKKIEINNKNMEISLRSNQILKINSPGFGFGFGFLASLVFKSLTVFLGSLAGPFLFVSDFFGSPFGRPLSSFGGPFLTIFASHLIT